MCLAPTPPQECSSENAFDTLVREEERVENENQHQIQEGFFQQHHIHDGFFQQHDIQDGFLQFAEELASEDVELPSNPHFEMISYGINNAPESFVSYIDLLNRPGQFDERNPQFFENDSDDIVPSHLHQEL